MDKKEYNRISRRLKKNVLPSRLRRIRDYRFVRVGDKVRCSRKGYPMTVTGILKTYHHMDDLSDATLYLDFEGNECDIWEVELRDVEFCGNVFSVILKKIIRRWT